MNPAEFFKDNLKHIEEVIKSICIRYHIHGEDAKDFSQDVKLNLIEDDYKKIRAFKGKSTFKTYLTTVISRIYIDYRREEKGYWRPSKVAKELGNIAVILEELIYRDRHTFQEAYAILTMNHKFTITEDESYDIYCKLPVRRVRPFTKDEGDKPLDSTYDSAHLNPSKKRPFWRGDKPLDSTYDSAPRPDEILITKEYNERKEKLLEVIKEIRSSLSSEESLLLKMFFEDDQKISVIARILNKDRNYVDRRIKVLLSDFRKKILATPGINEGDVIELIKFIEEYGEDNGW